MARDASVPLRVSDGVRVLPHSDREVVHGTAVTIRVALKKRWGYVSALLPHDRLAVNFEVREHATPIHYIEI